MINTDKDCSFKYSNVVAIKADKASTVVLSVFPNPVVNSLTISHSKAEVGATLQVIDINGKMIATYNIAANATQTSIIAAALLADQYIVNYINNQQKSKCFFYKIATAFFQFNKRLPFYKLQ